MSVGGENSSIVDDTTNDRTTLVVFCRRPQPGSGKRRIARDLGDGLTAELAELMLACAIEDAESWEGPVIVSPASGEDRRWASGLLDGRADVVAQPTGNLGERIAAIASAARDRGHTRLIFIGSDAPTLTDDFFARARRALDDDDVVLGPAADGGVTLMGTRREWPNLADLPWSSENLGAALERACTGHGLTVKRLESTRDVDLAADLPDLRRDIGDDARPARRTLANWLDRNRSASAGSISLVVPVLDDHASLSSLLERVRAMYPAPLETVVVDGRGDTHVAELCAEHGCRYLHTRAGRGHQLHAGATLAEGNAIWFLHADAEPPEDALEHIRASLDAGAVGGYFRFRFAGKPGWHKSILAAAINLRCRIGIPYGDQGLFIRRQVYHDLGGFADVPLFEETRFVRNARAAGRFEPLKASIGVSPRRWERDGWLRRTLHNRLLAIGHMCGVPPERLARRYPAGGTKPC